MTLLQTVMTVYKRKTSCDNPLLRKSSCLKIPKQKGERVLSLARKHKIINGNLAIQRDHQFIYVPILKESIDDLSALNKQASNAEFCEHLFPEKEKRKSSLGEQLEHDLPPPLLANLPHAMDFIGSIAIIEIPSELEPYSKLVGKAVLKLHKNIRTVMAKAGAISGTYRLRDFTVIAGESKTETLHKENGCKYYVDIAKAYFSPRLSSEHARISSLIKEGETIVDMFAGVGPFAVQIAKNHKDVAVYAIDVNPDAVKYLARNTRLNGVEERVHAVLGDARQVVHEKLSGIADRVIMNLPERAIGYIDIACEALKPQGGVLYFYSFATTAAPIENVRECFIRSVAKSGRKVVCVSSSRVRETAPFESQVVLEAEIR